MVDFETNEDQKRELEAGAFLILASFLAFLAGFAFVVVMLYRLWTGD